MPDAADPFALFAAWMAEASAKEINDPNAMTLATATAGGVPSARIVLLKGVDPRGFVFYTNTRSRKGAELTENPAAALLFHWKTLQRQIRIEGRVEHVTDAEADTYYASRPRISRLGAWASAQSRPLKDRETFERDLANVEARFPDETIPRPPFWSGWRLRPDHFEFWQDQQYRLHDRLTFARTTNGWLPGRLYP